MKRSQLYKQRFNKKISSESCPKDTLEIAVAEWGYFIAKLALYFYVMDFTSKPKQTYSQPAFISSKLIIETLEKGVKYVQS